jgi:hypothetical protein
MLKARFDWIVDDVPSYRRRIISIAQHTLEVALLPESLTAASSMHSARSLLCHLREALQI